MRHSPRFVSTALALISAIGVGCDYSTAPLPPGAVQFQPPPIYSRYWSIVESCSQRTADFGAWTFYTVPNGALREAGYKDAAAYANVDRHQIVFETGLENNPGPVRHEMLHAILGREYAHGGPANIHPPKYFRGLCEGVVYCDQGCEDAGPPPTRAPPDAQIISASELEIGVDVSSQVSHSGAEHELPIVLRATNRKNYPVWVMLAPTVGASPPAAHWIGFRIVPAEQPLPITDLTRVDSTGIVTVEWGGRVAFAANQTRWLVFDMSGRLYPPGNYQVVGVFNVRQTSVPLIVTP